MPASACLVTVVEAGDGFAERVAVLPEDAERALEPDRMHQRDAEQRDQNQFENPIDVADFIGPTSLRPGLGAGPACPRS